MNIKKLLFIIILLISNIAIGQNRCFKAYESEFSGDTVFAISLPDTTFVIDCDNDYICVVGVTVCFATDSMNNIKLDSFVVEEIRLWMVKKIQGDERPTVYRANPSGEIVLSIDDCLTSSIIDKFLSFITFKVQHSHFYSQTDIDRHFSSMGFLLQELIECRQCSNTFQFSDE